MWFFYTKTFVFCTSFSVCGRADLTKLIISRTRPDLPASRQIVIVHGHRSSGITTVASNVGQY